MKNLYLNFIFIALLISGCSKSDSDPNSSNFTANDITVICSNNNQLFQTDILNNTSNIEYYNLTETLGVSTNYDFFTKNSSLITFFKRIPNGFSTYQKNIINSKTYVADFPCGIDTDEYANFPNNSQEKILEFTTKPNGNYTDIFIRTFDQKTQNCSLITLNSGLIQYSKSTFLVGETIYVTYRNEQDKYEIDKVNLTTGQLENQLVFDVDFRATIANNQLYVFLFDNNFKTYNTTDLNLVSSSTFSVNNLSITSGFFKTSIKGNEMVIDLPYPQPNIILNRPTTIDLNSEAKVEDCDFGLINQKLAEQFKTSISFTKYAIDLDKNLIVVGFENPVDNTYGVVYTNFNADILKVVRLDYKPIEIIIR